VLCVCMVYLLLIVEQLVTVCCVFAWIICYLLLNSWLQCVVCLHMLRMLVIAEQKDAVCCGFACVEFV